ncbi:SpdD-like protein [Streptomyces sp. NPDC088553]|uniref:SpdD-like protein n=1 Tax=Streptomyces sp. NPDC088553 TaxID=3365864 RepID=UPI0038006859
MGAAALSPWRAVLRLPPLAPPPIPSAVDPHACGAGAVPGVQVERPTGRTPAGLAVVVAGGVGAVLVIGTVLVSMLLAVAVAVSAPSVAVCAVVLRSLLNGQHRQR